MELEDRDFEKHLAQKQYKELIAILTKILAEVSKEIKIPASNDVKVDTIDTKPIEKLLKTIADKEVSSDVPSAIKALGSLLVKKLDELKGIQSTGTKVPKEWTFTVNRSNTGYITSVTAKSND